MDDHGARVLAVGAARLIPGPLADYAFSLVPPAVPTVLLVTSGGASRDAFPSSRCRPTVVEPSDGTLDPAGFDLVCLDGLDPAAVVDAWLSSGAGGALRDASRAGTVVCGVGSGVVCLFRCGIVGTPGLQPTLEPGLGLLEGSVCPNHDRESVAGAYYGYVSRLLVPPGVGIDSGAAVLFEAGRVVDVVSERPGAHAYTLQQLGGEVTLKGLWARAL